MHEIGSMPNSQAHACRHTSMSAFEDGVPVVMAGSDDQVAYGQPMWRRDASTNTCQYDHGMYLCVCEHACARRAHANSCSANGAIEHVHL
jgi:hypothetical protein